MAEMRAKAVISAEDKTAGVFERIAARMGLINKAAAKANVMSVRASSAALSAQGRAMERAERSSAARMAVMGAASRVAGPLIGAAALTSATKQFAELDRRVTRIGITADASAPEVKGLAERLYQIGQSVALPTGDVTTGLETLVAQGRNLKDSLEFLPSVAKTAAATGASVEDIAKSADSVASNFKIAGGEMQNAFDRMATGGKLGQFELKEMARYLPSLGPAAAAVGFQGTKGLTDLVATLQVLRKGSGTSEEAAGSMSNILQKMSSEETTKRFKKMGVDLTGALEKARKEGRNLVEVFTDLTDKALKGDLSKLPQLINDMEFARGMRALLTFRGEAQRLAAQIDKTSRGAVELDLTRVQNDMQAKLDRLNDMVKHRARQIGSIIADIALPIDEKIKEIADGKNPIANAINDRAKLVVPDAIAREEIRTGHQGSYSAEERRVIDARKEYVQREMIDAERARLEGRVKALTDERARVVADGERQKASTPIPGIKGIVDARTKAKTDPLDQAATTAQAALSSFSALVSRMDEIQVRLAETGKPLSENKSLRIPNAQTGVRFDRTTPATKLFGINGPVGDMPDWMPPTLGKPMAHPLPPTRPESLPKAPVTAQDLQSIFGSIDFSNIEAKITQPVTATVEGPVTASLDPGSKVDVAVGIKVDGGTITSMSATAGGSARASVGASMGHLATR